MSPGEALKTLEWQLGDRLLQSEMSDNDVWVRISPQNWASAVQTVRDELQCQYFCFLSGIDWLTNPNLDGEKTFEVDPKVVEPRIIDGEAIERRAGGSSRFQVFGRVANIETGIGVTLLADLEDDMTVPTWTGVYKGADWHERETWEMYGITFTDHSDLRHIYLPNEFEGFPLRKDFALLARQVRPWPGLVDLEDMPAIEEAADE